MAPETSRDWSARMVTPVIEFGSAPLFRKEVVLDEGHGAGRLRKPARQQSRGLRGTVERPTGRTGRPQPRLERVRMAAALPHIRRGRVARGHDRAHHLRGERLVPRAAGLHGRPRSLRRPARRHRRTRDRVRGRPPADESPPTTSWVAGRIGRHRRRPVRRPDHRRPPALCGLVQPERRAQSGSRRSGRWSSTCAGSLRTSVRR